MLPLLRSLGLWFFNGNPIADGIILPFRTVVWILFFAGIGAAAALMAGVWHKRLYRRMVLHWSWQAMQLGVLGLVITYANMYDISFFNQHIWFVAWVLWLVYCLIQAYRWHFIEYPQLQRQHHEREQKKRYL